MTAIGFLVGIFGGAVVVLLFEISLELGRIRRVLEEKR